MLNQCEAVMFEVMIPKKLDYFPIIKEVLETPFDISKVKEAAFPTPEHAGADDELIDTLMAKDISDMFTGYSMYEVDGRFVNRQVPSRSPNRFMDERTIVIRLYFVARPDIDYAEFRSRARLGVHHCIGRQLESRLHKEVEIWISETHVDAMHTYCPDAPFDGPFK